MEGRLFLLARELIRHPAPQLIGGMVRDIAKTYSAQGTTFPSDFPAAFDLPLRSRQGQSQTE